MANRHTLHINKLEDFKEWLVKDGWEIEEPNGNYEVLRARKPSRRNPLIIYRKADVKEHLGIMDRDGGVVRAFLRDCKKPKTNADRIRSMSDEELAELFYSFHNLEDKIKFCKNKTECDNILDSGKEIPNALCKQCLVDWLRSEGGE